MINAIYFFATSIDLCTIFEAVEREFDIKYCANYVYAGIESEEKPRIEFNTIGEIAGSYDEFYHIVKKRRICIQYVRSCRMESVCVTLQGARRIIPAA